MKLYTRKGDDGTTALFGGQRIGKDDPRVEAYATVDELNCMLGLAAAECGFDELSVLLNDLQHQLFEIGGNLCGGPCPITDEHVAVLEQIIDRISATLPALNNFILPGGTPLAARLHLARTLCRRAERRIVTLAGLSRVDPLVLIYINRLGDLLFAMARRANQLADVDDVIWQRSR